MISFNNDYSEGAHPNILNALIETNFEQTDGYGEDYYTNLAYEKIKTALNCGDSHIRFLVGGTQTNLVVISHLLRPHQAVISSDVGHINVHETGAIEGTGHKVLTTEKIKDGKLTPETIKKVLDIHTDAHMVQPKMVYLSNPNELGAIYTKEELKNIYEFCKENNLYFYIDGARLSSALASEKNDIDLSDYKDLCDILYIGATKSGALFGEAVVFFNLSLVGDFQYSIKLRGALLAKGRLLGIQFNELFKNNLFIEIGKHANKMAKKIKDIFVKNNIPFVVDSYSNQLFVIFSNELIRKLSDKYRFSIIEKYDENNTVVRFVTSWATKEENVDEFIKDFEEIIK
ncbi:MULTISPECIES: low specificity L-threonine aldolase [Fusobacterium]|uniref:threonine aldolase family protein n=1 Tax=Fusobacterium TaxID=848 RepID=UPI0014771191|nr:MULTISPECIES: low specificity L-threonine aldolase [Fusobacterium]NME36630.1 low specificity L-threonine aldolase [Fusobacterium sp. FSA-380-WT-3A]